MSTPSHPHLTVVPVRDPSAQQPRFFPELEVTFWKSPVSLNSPDFRKPSVCLQEPLYSLKFYVLSTLIMNSMMQVKNFLFLISMKDLLIIVGRVLLYRQLFPNSWRNHQKQNPSTSPVFLSWFLPIKTGFSQYMSLVTKFKNWETRRGPRKSCLPPRLYSESHQFTLL